jgi:hypothetical protein
MSRGSGTRPRRCATGSDSPSVTPAGGQGSRQTGGRLKQPEREVLELGCANEILKEGARVIHPGGVRPLSGVMMSFNDAHRGEYEVEPICAVLLIAPSAHYEPKAR